MGSGVLFVRVHNAVHAKRGDVYGVFVRQRGKTKMVRGGKRVNLSLFEVLVLVLKIWIK